MTPETVNTNIISESAISARSGARVLALIAPEDTNSTVSPNVVDKYTRASDIENDFGTDSDLTVGGDAALDSGVNFLFAGAAEDPTDGSGVSDSISGSSDTGTITDTENLPITEVTNVQIDGSDISGDIEYTHIESPSSGDVSSTDGFIINTDTGEWATDTTPSSSVTIDYTYHDWDSLFDVLDQEAYEVHTVANHTFKAQYWGIWNKLLTHAENENKRVAAAYESGVVPGDVEAMTEALHPADDDSQSPGGFMSLLAAYYTGDLTSAWASRLAGAPIDTSFKLQAAPEGVSYTDSYNQSEYGNAVGSPTSGGPSDGTFHEFGANAVFEDPLGQFLISSDRAATATSNFYLWQSVGRMQRNVQSRIEDDLTAAQKDDSRQWTYTQDGLEAIGNVIRSALGFHKASGTINSFHINLPNVDDISDSDRQNRILDFVDVGVVLAGKIQLVELDLNVDV